MSGILCPVCRRLVPPRKDGRIRAHLGSRGHRGQCEGSGRLSVHVEMAMDEAAAAQAARRQPPESPWAQLTPAERFNAEEAWAMADSLYLELEAMKAAHGASERAVAEAQAAFRRAYRAAESLAPLAAYAGTEDGSGDEDG
jgi:hypothetical protein